MITCIECRQSWETEQRHARLCSVPLIDIKAKLDALGAR